MLTEVHFLSYAQVQSLKARRDIAVISVTDAMYHADLADGFGAVLRLRFADYDPARDGGGGHPHEFNGDHSSQLRQWVDAVHEDEAHRRLVVHCWAGISRSAAIAWWVHRRYGVPLMTKFPAYYLNRYVLHGLDASIETSQSPAGAPSRDEMIRIGRAAEPLPVSLGGV